MPTATDTNKGSLIEADEPFIAIKSESGAWFKMPKAPNLLRRGARGAVIYALSYMVVKALDKARKENPGSEAISSVDDIAHAFFYFENLIVSGGVSIVRSGYNALTSSQTGPETAEPAAPSAGTRNDVPAAKPEPKKPVVRKHHPTRTNLNAALAPKDIPAAEDQSSAPTEKQDFPPPESSITPRYDFKP